LIRKQFTSRRRGAAPPESSADALREFVFTLAEDIMCIRQQFLDVLASKGKFSSFSLYFNAVQVGSPSGS
jgi:hypothetical protein